MASICTVGGRGMIFPLLESEQSWPLWLRAVLYSLALVYVFLGVSVVADKFMNAIEAITSKKLRVRCRASGRIVTVKKWNHTVANLTLLALGSSAPEILLSIMEIVRNQFHAGALGPSTIVGSAAFNLFVIVAVCMYAIPSPDIRAIKHYDVFIITSIFSVAAYLWLVLIVLVRSPDVVEVWEAWATLAWFPVLIVVSYLADKNLSKETSKKVTPKTISSDQTRLAAALPTLGKAPGGCFAKTISDAAGAPIESVAGVLSFEEDFLEIHGDDHSKTICVPVIRCNGASGSVTCKYRTEKLSAIPGYDYDEAHGCLTFGPGVHQQELEVTIFPKRYWERSDSFQIILEDASGGARFNPNDDGGDNSCILTIKIKSSKRHSDRNTSQRILHLADSVNISAVEHGTVAWMRDIMDSVFDDGREEGENATTMSGLLHLISVPWKLPCALLIPPAEYAGGWICFIMALAMIGALTAVIIDFAELFGCVTGIPDAITAITFVALGTSMPDLFASKTAACQDETADASIVNVTGSNSVNVFLGIGIPWTMAAMYWAVTEPTNLWLSKYGTNFLQRYPHGTFVVLGGDLGFSVVTFLLGALVAFAVFRLKRVHFGGELGGPFAMKAMSSALLVMLWLFYIVLSSWKIFNQSADFGQQVWAVIIGTVVLQNIVFALCCVLKFSGAWSKRPDGSEKTCFEHLEEGGAERRKTCSLEPVDIDAIDLCIDPWVGSDALRLFRAAGFACMAMARMQRRGLKMKREQLLAVGADLSFVCDAASRYKLTAPPLPPPAYPPSDTEDPYSMLGSTVIVGTPVPINFNVAAWTCLAAIKLRRHAKETCRAKLSSLDPSSALVPEVPSFLSSSSVFASPGGIPVAHQPAPPQITVPAALVVRPRNTLSVVSSWFARLIGEHLTDFLIVGTCAYTTSQLAPSVTTA